MVRKGSKVNVDKTEEDIASRRSLDGLTTLVDLFNVEFDTRLAQRTTTENGQILFRRGTSLQVMVVPGSGWFLDLDGLAEGYPDHVLDLVVPGDSVRSY
jgi:hypothetical protein